jgi:4-aminobutyrate aminotransferase/(S)-3-amino-2-methylpropionate transaminase
MVGVELVTDRVTKEPAKDATQRVGSLAAERGVLTIAAGTYGNVIRTLMPLVVHDDQLEEGLDVLEGAIEQVSNELER